MSPPGIEPATLGLPAERLARLATRDSYLDTFKTPSESCHE